MYLNDIFFYLLTVVNLISIYGQEKNCRQEVNCFLPNCYCPTSNAPLHRDTMPQIVYFAFDDAVTSQVADYYRQLFPPTRRNPNGCPITASLYISHDYTVYKHVKEFYKKGFEIGVHSVTHSKITKKKQLYKEALGQINNLVKLAGVDRKEIIGWRSPYLLTAGDYQPEVLRELGFEYDTSLTYSRLTLSDTVPYPFTLDFGGWPYPCHVLPCPEKEHKGFWEVPVVAVLDHQLSYPCSFVDGCINRPETVEDSYKYLWQNFMSYYRGNRAPFGLHMHPAWFYDHNNLKGMDKFIEEILKLDDVYIVTTKQMLDWVKQPTKLSELSSLVSWQCGFKNQAEPAAARYMPTPPPRIVPITTVKTTTPKPTTWRRFSFTKKPTTRRKYWFTSWLHKSPITKRTTTSRRKPMTSTEPSIYRSFSPRPIFSNSKRRNTVVKNPYLSGIWASNIWPYRITRKIHDAPTPTPLVIFGNDLVTKESNHKNSWIDDYTTRPTRYIRTSHTRSYQTTPTPQTTTKTVTHKQPWWWDFTESPTTESRPVYKVSANKKTDVGVIRAQSTFQSDVVAARAGNWWVQTANPPFHPSVVRSSKSSNTWSNNNNCVQGSNCRLPRCFCETTDIGLKLKETPQFVLLTFDGNINSLTFGAARKLFKGLRNPNRCPMQSTFFITQSRSIGSYLKTLYRGGMEIALRGFRTGRYHDFTNMNKDMLKQINALKNIGIDDITGWRSPSLVPFGDKQFDALSDNNFLYDSTLSNNRPIGSNHATWPYTLDFGWNGKCSISPCPKNRHSGIWEVPNRPLLDYVGSYECEYADGCLRSPETEAATMQFLHKNFLSYYKTNKAPFILNFRHTWLSHHFYERNVRGIRRFLEELEKMEDVYVVTMTELINWMKQPTSVSEMKHNSSC